MTAGPYGSLLDAVRGVRWPAARRVGGATLGAHPSRLRGNSSEFSEFRPYRQGDDPRRVDWRLLARSDRAYVRLTTDRATLRTAVLVDASASMAFPLPDLTKWVRAREIAVALAAVAHAEADPVGLTIASESPVTLTPRARRSVIVEMIRALDTTTPAGAPALAPHLAAMRAPPRGAGRAAARRPASSRRARGSSPRSRSDAREASGSPAHRRRW